MDHVTRGVIPLAVLERPCRFREAAISSLDAACLPALPRVACIVANGGGLPLATAHLAELAAEVVLDV